MKAKKKFTVEIGNLIIKLARVDDPEALFEEFLKSDPGHIDIIDERIPYWSELWPSAIGLSEFIEKNPSLVKGKRVVEIGCGLALPGIVSALLGGKTVLTDYLAPALEFASYNWKLNIDIEPVTQILDWRSPGDFEPADVILASDVAYESRAFIPLFDSLKKLLKKDGIIIISEPNRSFAKKFFEKLEKDFDIQKENKKIQSNGIDNKVSVYLLKRRSSVDL